MSSSHNPQEQSEKWSGILPLIAVPAFAFLASLSPEQLVNFGFASAAISAVRAIIGSVSANLLTDSAKKAWRVLFQHRSTGEALKNLVASSLKDSLIELAADDRLRTSRQTLLAMANQAREVLDSFDEASSPTEIEGRPILLALIHKERHTASETDEDTTEWGSVVRKLEQLSGLSLLGEAERALIAKLLPEIFRRSLWQQIVGQSAIGMHQDTVEAENQACFFLLLREEVMQLQRLPDEIIHQQWNMEDRLKADLERLVDRISRRLSEACAQLSDNSRLLQEIHKSSASFEDIISREGRIRALRTLGLVPHSTYESTFWREIRNDRGLKALWEQRDCFVVVQEQFFGRDNELSDFRAFLDSSEQETLLWSADPGVGKSRLAIEAARIAADSGWDVYFVNNSIGRVAEAYEQLESSNSHVLIIWDDFRGPLRGEDVSQLRRFINIPTHDGRRLKRIITSWPQLRHEIIHGHTYDKKFVDRSLSPIDARSLARLALALRTSLSDDEAGILSEKSLGNSYVLFASLALLYSGVHLNLLGSPETILRSAFEGVVQGILPQDPVSRRKYQKVLRILSFVRSIHLNEARTNIEDLEMIADHLSVLNIIEIDETNARLANDHLRRFIVRESISGKSTLMGRVDRSSLVAELLPFTKLSIWEVWSITRLAEVKDDIKAKELLDDILAGIRDGVQPSEIGSVRDATLVLANAVAAESDPVRQRRILFQQTRCIRFQRKDLGVLGDRAYALLCACMVTSEPRRRRQYADQIRRTLARALCLDGDSTYIAEQLARALIALAYVLPSQDGRQSLSNILKKLHELAIEGVFVDSIITIEYARSLILSITRDGLSPKQEYTTAEDSVRSALASPDLTSAMGVMRTCFSGMRSSNSRGYALSAVLGIQRLIEEQELAGEGVPQELEELLGVGVTALLRVSDTTQSESELIETLFTRVRRVPNEGSLSVISDVLTIAGISEVSSSDMGRWLSDPIWRSSSALAETRLNVILAICLLLVRPDRQDSRQELLQDAIELCPHEVPICSQRYRLDRVLSLLIQAYSGKPGVVPLLRQIQSRINPWPAPSVPSTMRT